MATTTPPPPTTTGRSSTTDPDPKSDPLLTFMFSVSGTISGLGEIQGYFSEISGPKEEVAVVSFKTVHFRKNKRGSPTSLKLPGRPSKEPITLKRGLTNDMTFWEWWRLVRTGKLADAKTNITITMYNRKYEALVQWDVKGAWPHKISFPDFQAGSSEFGLEEITLVHSGFEFKTVGASSSSTSEDAGADMFAAMTGGVFDYFDYYA